jgi:TonB family protein
MSSVINFLYESGISLSIFSLIYVIFLRKETFFRANRIFLLISVLFSLILPLLHIPVFAPQSNLLGEIKVTPYQNLIETVVVSSQGFSETVETAVSSSALILYGYLLGILVFLILFLVRSIQLWRLIRRSEVIDAKTYHLVVVDEPISPFSFLKYIFVSRNFREMPGHQRMLMHELEHVKQGHTWDVLILEVLTIFQWFNPFMWILRRAIRENHEYLADKAVLSAGIRPAEYKELLLNQFVGGPYLATSHFNYSLIRNRIRMMTRMESPRIALAKTLPGILIAAALILIFACEHKNSGVSSISGKNSAGSANPDEAVTTAPESLDTENHPGDIAANAFTTGGTTTSPGNISARFRGDTLSLTGTREDLQKFERMLASGKLRTVRDVNRNESEVVQMDVILADKSENTSRQPSAPMVETEEQVFFIVEEMPEYPGGEPALRRYIANTVRYPTEAQDKGIQGRVYVQFVVTKDGSVANAKIARGVDPHLDQEALRVVNSLPKWVPGRQRGQAVAVSYTVPISFVLQ